MALKFNFTNLKEMEALFNKPDVRVANGVVAGIQKGLTTKKKVAKLFEISFEGDEYEYTIDLHKDQWFTALKACLEKYEQLEMYDQAIDTYQLIQNVLDCE